MLLWALKGKARKSLPIKTDGVFGRNSVDVMAQVLDVERSLAHV
jgi:hypothetical protein